MEEVGRIVVPVGGLYGKAGKALKQSLNMSGLVCIGKDRALMVSDEGVGLHRLHIERTSSGVTVSHEAALSLQLPPDLEGDDTELDLEAVARFGNRLLLVGSHANERKKGGVNPAAHSIWLVEEDALLGDKPIVARRASLDGLFHQWQRIGTGVNAQLQCAGLNVEGATVFQDRLLIGLRSPVRQGLGVRPAAFVISTPVKTVMDGDFSSARLHKLPTGRPFIGIRDMEAVGSSVLVVTGDAGVGDLETGAAPQCGENINRADEDRPFQLRLWHPGDGDRLERKPVHEFDRLDGDPATGSTGPAKVEGIAKDPARDHAYFVVFDGDPRIFHLVDKRLP